jgi:hypothetical protein
MFSFFFGKPKPPRDLHQLIFDIAEHKKARDLEELYRRLPRMNLHVSLVSSAVPLQPGQTITTDATTQLVMRTARLPNNMVFVLAFLDRNDPRIGSNGGELTAREALTMTLKTTTDGLLIYNRQESWTAIPRTVIQDILRRHFR